MIRVFISSTFNDLKLERDALQQRVFPNLEQRCLKEGFQFQAIDLRWGISTEAGLDHRTMRICLEELHRSQEVSPEPNFLILLGNRYGWRPLPEAISAEEFQRLDQAAEVPASLEVLRRWYQRDENALIPVYLLQPRLKQGDGNPEETDYTTPKAWRAVEQVLWQIINVAFPVDDLTSRFNLLPTAPDTLPSIVRFQASATEQEIWHGAFTAANPERHVLAFFRDITNSDEFAGSALQDYFDLTESCQIDEIARSAQNQLREAIQQRLGDNAVALPAVRLILDQTSGGSVTLSTDHIDILCREVESRLWSVIDRQIDQWRGGNGTVSASPPVARSSGRELEIEIADHLRFGAERAPRGGFLGRETEVTAIRRYLLSDQHHPLVVYGPAGTGKTALLAHLALVAGNELGLPDQTLTLVRFLGSTPASSTLRSLLTSLCQQLRRYFPREQDLPTEIQQLEHEFQEQLAQASAQRPIHVFLDALEQLDDADGGRQLDWLRLHSGQPLPENVKLIVSCLSDAADDPEGQPFRRMVQLGRLKTGICLDELSPDEAVELLLNHWLKPTLNSDDPLTDHLGRPRRTLTQTQRSVLETHLRRPEAVPCRRPLYLKILFEEARLWRSNDPPPRALPNSAERLMDHLVDRLSQEVNHGQLLVERALGYLAAARRGLSETELLEVLFADEPGYKSHLEAVSQRTRHTLPCTPPRIPVAIWSRLRSDLAPYLTERAAPGGTVLTFYHRQIARWAKARFVEVADWKPRGRLAAFFQKQSSFWNSIQPPQANSRKADELPWLWEMELKWSELHTLLTDERFLVALWNVDRYATFGYWQAIERNSAYRITTSHADMGSDLAQQKDAAWIVARLWGDLGHHDFAMRLWRMLADWYQQNRASRGPVWIEDESIRKERYALARGLNNLAVEIEFSGRPEEALRMYREVRALATDMGDADFAMATHTATAWSGDLETLQTSFGNEGALHFRQRRYEQAEPLFKIQLQLCQLIHHEVGLQRALGNLGAIHLLREEPREALEWLDQQESICRRVHLPEDLARNLLNRAVALKKLGRIAEALAALDEQQPLCQRYGYGGMLRQGMSFRQQLQMLG